MTKMVIQNKKNYSSKYPILVVPKLETKSSLIFTDLSIAVIFFSHETHPLKKLNSNIYTGKEVPGRKPKNVSNSFSFEHLAFWSVFGRKIYLA